ncbi:hypothetical protein [Pseudooceanicola sp.]|uniref:hypothetical protein n=1 Tax=Pseudooceanicola sp. TaxID=1914328 RepID=UPI004058B02E
MFQEDQFNNRVAEATKALKTAFGGNPKSLEQALKRAGRRLPRRARKAGAEIVAAQMLSANPKLHQQLDASRLERDFDKLISGAGRVDAKALRQKWLVGALASFAFNLLLLITLLVVVALWRGWL